MQTGTQPNSAYDVRELPNPFLGLYSYTFNERKRFAGRSRALLEILHRLTALRQTPLFITGPSGVGKSSFAQAALLPELENYYTERNLTSVKIIVRPGNYPLSALAEALAQIETPQILVPDLGVVGALNEFLSQVTPAEQVNLILIDRFEEVFTLAHQGQSEIFLEIISQLAAFNQTRTHIIITLNSSFIPKLASNANLSQLIHNGYTLPDMNFEELCQAITRPVEHVYSGAGKQFEPGLVEQIARDALQRPNSLPWLQITLRQIWASGWLITANYYPAMVIRDYAEAVLQRKNYSGGNWFSYPARPQQEQREILAIFASLICADWWQGAGQPRLRSDLENKSVERHKLIDELTNAQLLKVNVDSGREFVELAHERLVSSWERLNEMSAARRRELLMEQDFQQALNTWLSRNRAKEYLLVAQAVKDARQLKRQKNSALTTPEARDFYGRSQRRASALRNFRTILTVFIVLGLALGNFGNFGNSRRSQRELPPIPMPEPVITVIQPTITPTRPPVNPIENAFGKIPFVKSLNGNSYREIVYSPDGTLLAAINQATKETELEFWNTETRQIEKILHLNSADISNLVFSPNGELVAYGAGSTIFLKNVKTFETVFQFKVIDNNPNLKNITPNTPEYTDSVLIKRIGFSPNGQFLVVGATTHTYIGYQITIIDTKSGQVIVKNLSPEWSNQNFELSNNGLLVVVHRTRLEFWSLETLKLISTFALVISQDAHLTFSPDSKFLATPNFDDTVSIWSMENGKIDKEIKIPQAGQVEKLAFSPDSKYLATYGRDRSLKVWTTEGVLVKSYDNLPTLQTMKFQGTHNNLTFAVQETIYFSKITLP